jgi:hypothetical protein
LSREELASDLPIQEHESLIDRAADADLSRPDLLLEVADELLVPGGIGPGATFSFRTGGSGGFPFAIKPLQTG